MAKTWGGGVIAFTVPGRIRGKGRIRHFGKQHFMDVKTRSDEALIRHFASQAMKGSELLSGPLSANIVVTINPPPSWSKKRRETARYVTGRPDCDNSQKLIFDACNGIVYGDDSQISYVTFARFYSLEGQERVDVSFSALEVQVEPPKTAEEFVERCEAA